MPDGGWHEGEAYNLDPYELDPHQWVREESARAVTEAESPRISHWPGDQEAELALIREWALRVPCTNCGAAAGEECRHHFEDWTEQRKIHGDRVYDGGRDDYAHSVAFHAALKALRAERFRARRAEIMKGRT